MKDKRDLWEIENLANMEARGRVARIMTSYTGGGYRMDGRTHDVRTYVVVNFVTSYVGAVTTGFSSVPEIWCRVLV